MIEPSSDSNDANELGAVSKHEPGYHSVDVVDEADGISIGALG
jgi:hypothetical protein